MERVIISNSVRALGGLAIGMLLVSCGGGSPGANDDGLTQLEREDRAASVWPGMLTFAQALIASSSTDSADTRPVAGINPPLSETDEPAAI